LSQSVAIVTGSSFGIGRATAIRLSCDFSLPSSLCEVGERAGPRVIIDLILPAAAKIVSQTLAKVRQLDEAKQTPNAFL
jgi:NAD(P)-dependent dehydrogenase (short-subunit alcohol dehydrogenase family)